jgi:hypothetical protein
MNTVEERLRAATQAAAGTVAPGSAPPLHLPSQPGRRPGTRPQAPRGGWPRWVAPLAAAASVIAVVAASLVITSGSQHREPPARAGHGRITPLASVPPYFVSIAGRKPGIGIQKQRAVVRGTATGNVLAAISPPRPYQTFTAVTAAADDRTFVLAAGKWSVKRMPGGGKVIQAGPAKFFRLRLGPGGRAAGLTALPVAALPGQLAGIALSPDGSKLAVAFNRRAGDRVVDPAIRVITLAGGSARTWVWPGRAWITSNDATNQQLLSWAADERTIAFEQWLGDDEQVRLLDTAAAGSSLRSARLALDFPHQAYTDWKFVHGRVAHALSGYNALITPDGTRIVCGTATVTRYPVRTETEFTEFSASTGRVERSLRVRRFSRNPGDAQDVLWTSPSGSTLIVTIHQPAANRAGYRTVLGVLTGNRFTPIPVALQQNISDMVW